MSFSNAKFAVRAFHADLETAKPETISALLSRHVSDDYRWRGLHPFHEQSGADAVSESFWTPFLTAFPTLQRRTDIFFAGNSVTGDDHVWVCAMGNFLGLFDKSFLDIPATGRLTHFRFAEFHRVVDGKIAESAQFFDLLSLMDQAGVYPLPPQTGAHFLYPGPRTQDGLLFDDRPKEEGTATINLVNDMVAWLGKSNAHDDVRMPREALAQHWVEDMLWFGPYGIGATMSVDRYQEQQPGQTSITDGEANLRDLLASFVVMLFRLPLDSLRANALIRDNPKKVVFV